MGGVLYEWGISRPMRRLGDRYLSRPKKKVIGFLGRGKRKCTKGMKRGVKIIYSGVRRKRRERARGDDELDEKLEKNARKDGKKRRKIVQNKMNI